MKINISIDDVSPHPKSSTAVLKQCYRLIEEFPDIKFTLFIPTAYWRTVKPATASQRPFFLHEYPDFCNEILSLPAKNFELGFHGHFHGIPGKSDNDELQNASYDNALEIIQAMLAVLHHAGLQDSFKKIIRPPAWRMSPEAIKAFRTCKFKVLALSPDDYALATYKGEHKKAGDVVFYDSAPPFKPLVKLDKLEVVYHACEWDKNYLSADLMQELSAFIKQHMNVTEFCFMEDLL